MSDSAAALTRETVTAALYELLITAAPFRTTGRRLKLWSQVDEQPALFLRNAGEETIRTVTRSPAKVVMEFEVWLYSNAGDDPDTPPSIGLNILLDAVAGVLDPFPRQTQSLGGLVTHAWIEGRTDLHPGDLNGQAIAVVPVKVLVPTFGG